MEFKFEIALFTIMSNACYRSSGSRSKSFLEPKALEYRYNNSWTQNDDADTKKQHEGSHLSVAFFSVFLLPSKLKLTLLGFFRGGP